MSDVVMVALSVSTISMTLAKSVLFKSLRDALSDVPFIGQLMHCPYCLSHWLAFAFAFNISSSFEGLIINTFAVVCLASFFSIGIDVFLNRIDNDVH